jgi:hypothetical protein
MINHLSTEEPAATATIVDARLRLRGGCHGDDNRHIVLGVTFAVAFVMYRSGRGWTATPPSCASSD